MKSLSSSFSGGAMTLARCWRIIDQRAQVSAFTDHDCDIVYAEAVHHSVHGLQTSAIETVLGFSASSQEMSGLLTSPGLVEDDIVAGFFDGARVEVDLVDWKNISNIVRLHTGLIGEIRRAGAGFTAEIRSLSARLDEERGRLYRATCAAEFCDPRCGLRRDDPLFSIDARVIETDAKSMVVIDRAALPFDLTGGSLRFLSGACAGLTATVSSFYENQNGLSVFLWSDMPRAIAAHDQILIEAGCDKYFQTCRDTYRNSKNFRGFPHMPGNDFVIAGVVEGSPGMDGGSFFR